MKTKLFSLALLAIAPALFAQNSQDLQTSAYRSSIAQDEVRRQAEQARAQLQLMLEDFQQNQLDTAEFAQVQQTIAKLSSLSDEEMLPLVKMLKEAGGLQQASETQGKLTSASQAQKNIQVSLKSMADRLALQMNQASMERRLQQLVLSQTANLRQTKELVATPKAGDKLPPGMAPLVTLSQNEQASIRQETELMLATLDKVLAGMPEAERAGFAGAFEEAKRLGVAAMAATATQDMAGNKFVEAMGSEGRLLDGLQAMLMKIRGSLSTQERVEAMANQLQQLASEQSQLAQATEKANPAAQKDLREEQKKLSNEVEALKKELTGLNAPASKQAEQAEKAMEQATDTLKAKDAGKDEQKKAAAKSQKEAADKLQAAGDALQKQAKEMADAAKDAPKNAAEAMQDLAKLDQSVQDALSKQKALDAAPNAATSDAQQKLAEATAKLQQQALASSPQAAQSLGQAASQMSQNSENKPAASPSESLADASAQLQQQMAAVQEALKEQAALQALAGPIQEANKETQKAGENIAQTPKDLSPAVKEMMSAQQTLNQAQSQTGSEAVPDLPQALKEAQAQLDSSVLDAAQSKSKEAAASNSKAQEAMNKALQSLDKAMAASMAKAAAAAPAMAGAPGAPMPGGQMPGGQMPGSQNSPTGQVRNGQGGMGGQVAQQTSQGFLTGSGAGGGQGQVVTGLKPKDRAAVSALQKEKAPAEYQGMVQQYMKNLAEGASPGHGGQ